MKGDYSKYPQVCEQCERILFEKLDRNEKIEYVHCDHEQTLLLLARDGKEIKWTIYGSISRSEVQLLLSAATVIAQNLAMEEANEVWKIK